MPRTLTATVAIMLPDDEFDAAEAMLKAKPLFMAFTTALLEAGLSPQVGGVWQQLVRPSRVTQAGKRRGRPPQAPKLVRETLPSNGAQDPSTEPPEAA